MTTYSSFSIYDVTWRMQFCRKPGSCSLLVIVSRLTSLCTHIWWQVKETHHSSSLSHTFNFKHTFFFWQSLQFTCCRKTTIEDRENKWDDQTFSANSTGSMSKKVLFLSFSNIYLDLIIMFFSPSSKWNYLIFNGQENKKHSTSL